MADAETSWVVSSAVFNADLVGREIRGEGDMIHRAQCDVAGGVTPPPNAQA